MGKIFVDVLIIENLANYDDGGKIGLKGAKNIDPKKFVAFEISQMPLF